MAQEIWEVVYKVYGFNPEPQTDQAHEFLRQITEYVTSNYDRKTPFTTLVQAQESVIPTNGGQQSTEQSPPVKRGRGRPPGAKNKGTYLVKRKI